MPALSVLFFLIIERSALIVLVFYYKGMSEKVWMQETHAAILRYFRVNYEN